MEVAHDILRGKGNSLRISFSVNSIPEEHITPFWIPEIQLILF
jgi:hypothetical protein